MAKVGEAYVELFAKMDRLKKDMSKAGNLVKKDMKRMAMAAKGFGAAVSGAMRKARMAILALIGAMAGVLHLTAQQIKAEVRLAAAMKATGNAAGFTVKQMKEMATALQFVLGESDEAIMGAQAILSTFVNIRGRQFVETMEVLADLKVLFDTDLKGAAIQLGKALNDPIIGMTALTRVGVSFTEQEKKTIKEMMAMNKVVETQTFMLKILQNQGIKGLSRALAESLPGRLALLKGMLGDLVQAFGKAVTAGIPWENLLGRVLAATQWMEKNGDKVKEIFWAIGKAIAAVLKAIVIGVYHAIKAISDLVQKISKDRATIGAFFGGLEGTPGGSTTMYPSMSTEGILPTEVKTAMDAFGEMFQNKVRDSREELEKFKNEAKDTVPPLIALKEGAEEAFRKLGRAISTKFFTTMGRPDIAKRLEITQAVNEQMKAIDEWEQKLKGAGKWTQLWAKDLRALREALLITAEAERRAIDEQNRSNMTSVAAGFTERFAGIGRVKLDTGFNQSNMRTVSTEGTAKQQLTTLTQIRDILETSLGFQDTVQVLG